MYKLVNITGTRNVIDECINTGVKKLVYTSSGGVIFNGELEVINVDERIDYPEKQLDYYNETKVAAEKMVLAANSDSLLTCAIRPAGIFGPGDQQGIQAYHQVMKNNQTRWQMGSNDNLADFTYVGNVAHAHLLAADKLGKRFSYDTLSDPLPAINISLGNHRVPTSDAHPLGPNIIPGEADLAAAKKFEAGEIELSDYRPVLRNKMDQFSAQAENDHGSCPIAGQAFFITNGEPLYFWEFPRALWKELGHTPPYLIKIPNAFCLILADLAATYSWLRGTEPGLTRFRVANTIVSRNYDIEKARRMLGYEPIVSLDEGIKRWATWYLAESTKQMVQETEKTK